MITKITGTLNRVLDEEIRLQVGPFEYQVLVPEFVRRQVQTRGGQELTFHVIEYLEANQMSSRMVPRRIGFLHETELEFFDLFCTVDKIGVKKALKAMGRSIREIADAIQRQDTKWLSTLPGIGKTSAEQIIATLRTKVTKFALMAAPREAPEDGSAPAIVIDATVYEDAYAGLMTLGLSPIEARTRIDAVIRGGKECKSAAEIINAVFRREE
jgi:Holliday junction DNA helicase RuvA